MKCCVCANASVVIWGLQRSGEFRWGWCHDASGLSSSSACLSGSNLGGHLCLWLWWQPKLTPQPTGSVTDKVRPAPPPESAVQLLSFPCSNPDTRWQGSSWSQTILLNIVLTAWLGRSPGWSCRSSVWLWDEKNWNLPWNDPTTGCSLFEFLSCLCFLCGEFDYDKSPSNYLSVSPLSPYFWAWVYAVILSF